METHNFNEETHEYLIDGVKYPSVTDIISPISFERMNAINRVLLENARNRGTAVHDICQSLLLLGEIDYEEVPQEYLPYVYSFEYWYKTYKPKVIYSELPIYSSELGYCGTIDFVCEIDGEIAIIDFKSSSAIDYKSVSTQLAGYKNLFEWKFKDKKASKCYVLHLKKTQDFTFSEVQPDYEWFEILLKHNKKMNEKRGRRNDK